MNELLSYWITLMNDRIGNVREMARIIIGWATWVRRRATVVRCYRYFGWGHHQILSRSVATVEWREKRRTRAHCTERHEGTKMCTTHQEELSKVKGNFNGSEDTSGDHNQKQGSSWSSRSIQALKMGAGLLFVAERSGPVIWMRSGNITYVNCYFTSNECFPVKN